jgi:hypothetical protein
MYIFYLFNVVLWLWAGVLLSTPETVLPTPLSQFYQYSDHSATVATILIISALAGLAGSRTERLWLLWPQEFIAVVVSLGAIVPVFNQKYPDGVSRGWRFILADQALSILLGVFHTLAVIDLTYWKRRRKWWM